MVYYTHMTPCLIRKAYKIIYSKVAKRRITAENMISRGKYWRKPRRNGSEHGPGLDWGLDEGACDVDRVSSEVLYGDFS